MTIFAKKLRANQDASPLGKLVSGLRDQVVHGSFVTQGVAQAALSMESISEQQSIALSDATQTLSQALESIAADMNMSADMTGAQRDAAVVAGAVSGDIRAFLRQPTKMDMVSTESMHVVGSNVGDAVDQRVSVEAYDEKDNRNAVVYSIAYNLQAARQDEFGEAFFPTITVSPDNVGLMVSIRLFRVFDDFKRNISGALDQYNKKSLLRAYVDYTILKNDQTRLIPVHRAQSAANFVDPLVIAPRTIIHEGESIDTSVLAVGKKFSLLAISQTDTLLASGVMDVSDSIDPAVTLSAIYVKVGTDILKFATENLPLSAFSPAPQGLHRLMNLNFATTSLLINKDTKNADGSALAALADVVNDDLIVRLEANVTGSVNVELGDTSVYGNNVGLFQIQNQLGDTLDPTVAPALAVATALAGATIIGYDLRAYRTNLNRRTRGQLIDTSFYNQFYPIPLRSPITALRPVTTDGQTDTSDLAALITATHIRTSNAAVTTLLETSGMLAEYVDSRDTAGDGPDVLGISRMLVRPTYFRDTIDAATDINSLTSSDRIDDLQALIVNKIRDLAYAMYRDSNYKSASDAIYGGISKTPTVIIGTDPVIARYLMVNGDLRTLGPDFEVKVVHTVDARVSGKIFVTFGQFEGESNSKVNPLHFGNMGWKPELTLVLPISRDGQTSKELTVQPSFLHVVNLPLLAELDVQNISSVVASSVTINTHPIP